jgi:hypothetical protein
VDPRKFEQAIEAMERDMIASNRRKHRVPRVHGLPLMCAQASDSPRVIALLDRYNSAVRSYNALAGQMGHIIQRAIDQNALQTRPRGSLLGVIDEWLRLRLARGRSLLWDVDPLLHLLEVRMKNVYHGTNGIDELERQITKLRC